MPIATFLEKYDFSGKTIMLLIPESFSIYFNITYIYCGISDMLDGFIARKSKSESEIGDRLDSTADVLFVAPFIIVNTNSILFEIIICSIATFAAVQEGYCIRKSDN